MILTKKQLEEHIFSLMNEDVETYKKLFRQQVSKKNTDIISDMLVKHNLKNVFISFRSGLYTSEINVRTRYNTPVGLYCYPIIPLLKKKTKLSNTKEIRDMSDSDFFTRGIFPFASENKLYYLFHISDTSDVLYTSDDSKDKIMKYINRIKDLYKDNPRVISICDEYIKTNRQYSNFLGTSKEGVWGFWLMIYAIGEVVRSHKKLSNFFSNLVYKIGIKGFVDDLGLGMIHKNEPLQAVFFFGHQSIVDDDKYVSKTEGLKFQLPRDKPYVDKSYGHDNKNDKLKAFLEKRFGKKYSFLDDINYKKFIYNVVPIPLNIYGTMDLEFIEINPYEKTYKIINIKNMDENKYPYSSHIKERIKRQKVK